MNFILVFIGGGLGSMSRYAVTLLVKHFTTIAFPFATLIVNVVGSFLMGIITSLIAGKFFTSFNSPEPLRLLFAVGFLGGFTTFSSFSMETLTLLQKNEIVFAIANVLINMTIGLLAAYAGFNLVKS